VEGELEQRRVLDRLRLDALDAVDVEEVVLVVIGDEPFHLRRAHPAIGLRDVDDREIEIGEDVGPHPADGEPRRQRHGHGGDQDRDRAPQGGANQPHG
jgi:hypothetical protein